MAKPKFPCSNSLDEKALAAVGVVVAMVILASAACAADKLRIGKPEARAFDFAAIEIGTEEGIFAGVGIEAESTAFGGAAMVHQAMTAKSLDIALGSGPEMASIAKGAPEKAVAAFFGAPMNIAIIVRADSPITAVSQLKGKTIAAGSLNSLTGWVAVETARREGWGPNGITVAGVGSRQGIIAQLLAGNVDAGVEGTEDAYMLQAAGKARILIRMGEVIPDFLGHVIFASDDLIATNPDLLRRFLKGWFDTIAFMKANQAETTRIAGKISDLSPEIAATTYREQMPLFSDDGKFEPKAVAVVQRSMVDLGMVDHPVDMTTLYTEAFLPGAK
jgi:ABC-type nitrate/sulfonate/bicarbonate transport system substrate-binding protein